MDNNDWNKVCAAGVAMEKATYMFSDLVGSTKLKQSLDEDQSYRSIAKLNEIVTACVLKSGMVCKYLGDGVMALFLGDGKEDNAIRCALEIQRQVNQLRTIHGHKIHAFDISCRIAIATGDVSVVKYANDHNDIFSKTLDFLAAMVWETEPNEILCDETTVNGCKTDDLNLRIHPCEYRHLKNPKVLELQTKVYPINWMTNAPGLMRYFWKPDAKETRKEFVKCVKRSFESAAKRGTAECRKYIFGITRTGNFAEDLTPSFLEAKKARYKIKLLIHEEPLEREHYKTLEGAGIEIRKFNVETIKLAGVHNDNVLIAAEVLSKDKISIEYPWISIQNHRDSVRLIEEGFMSWWRKAEPLFSYTRIFFFDLDGVLIHEQHYKIMLEVLKIPKDDEAYKKYDEFISKRDVSDDQLKLLALKLKGFTKSQLDEVDKRLNIRPEMQAFVKFLKDRYFRIVIVTHGVKDVAKLVAEKLGLNPADVIANEMLWDDQLFTGEMDACVRARGKGIIIKNLLKREGIEREVASAIGDGLNDLELWSAVDGVKIFYRHEENREIQDIPQDVCPIDQPADIIEALCERYEMEMPKPMELISMVRREKCEPG